MSGFNKARSSERGLTLLEVTLMLVVSMTLMGALLPVATATRRHAEQARALTDETNLSLQLNAALANLTFSRFTLDGTNGGGAANTVSLLVSDGDMPRQCTAGAGCGGGAATWDRLVTVGSPAPVDFFERHLVTNNPGGSSLNDYPVVGGANFWRGPYVNAPINPDPWGNRYMVNSEHFNSPASRVIVLSAGPDEIIQTVFTSNGFVFPTPAGDDVATLVQL